MEPLNVKIVELPPLRVASAYGFGTEPEMQAHGKLMAWAKAQGFEPGAEHRVFGFNNPSPSPVSPNYGYEFWMVVGPEVQPEGEIRITGFEGGLYAVAECPVPEGDFEVIGAGWRQLVPWRENSPYQHGDHQWLEEHLPANAPGMLFTLLLYLPVRKP